mmetsp:Transcript_104112/g.299881  ORF Transcript_104112/g.299881 Transcript_104112/m.299881 type:complete len:361 (-) Transcript_104112:338-1420(-)
MNALPFCGVCSVADLGSCGCCAEPTDGATGGATDAHTSDPSSSMANSGPTIGSSVADGGAADATVAGTTAVNSATSTSAASVASTPSPWALSPGQTTFAPTTLTAVFNPGKDIVRAGRHTPDVKASCLLAWRTNMPSPGDPDADTALEMRIKAACTVLETRLLSVLRTENSQVYNVNVAWGRTSLNSYGMINVGYGCDPERTNEVESMLKAELEKFKAEGASVEEVEAVKSILTERHQLALDNNSYWIFYILDAYKAYKADRAFHEGRGEGVGRDGRLPSRAEFVDNEAASHSTDRVAIHIEPLDPEVVRSTVTEVFPLEGSLSLTLLPEVSPEVTVAEEPGAEGRTGVSQQGAEVISSL